MIPIALFPFAEKKKKKREKKNKTSQKFPMDLNIRLFPYQLKYK